MSSVTVGWKLKFWFEFFPIEEIFENDLNILYVECQKQIHWLSTDDASQLCYHTNHSITAHRRSRKSRPSPPQTSNTSLSLHRRLCGYATCAENNKKSSPNRGRGSTARGLVRCGVCLRAGHRGRRPNFRTRPCTPTREPQGTWHQRQTEADLTVGSCPDKGPLTTVRGWGTWDQATHPLTGQCNAWGENTPTACSMWTVLLLCRDMRVVWSGDVSSARWRTSWCFHLDHGHNFIRAF